MTASKRKFNWRPGCERKRTPQPDRVAFAGKLGSCRSQKAFGSSQRERGGQKALPGNDRLACQPGGRRIHVVQATRMGRRGGNRNRHFIPFLYPLGSGRIRSLPAEPLSLSEAQRGPNLCLDQGFLFRNLGGGDLSTEQGSRLRDGTLRLSEGLVTLLFDSGAEVTLEAPVSLKLIDSMQCELINGTAVTYAPESALGFRIITPEADVVDYGTRFSVTVFEETGETHTRVMEGKVRVEYTRTGEIVALSAGERHTVKGNGFAIPPAETFRELGTIPDKPLQHGPEWTFFESSKDAFVGRRPNHLFVTDDKEVVDLLKDSYASDVHNLNSKVLLLVKNAISQGPMNRQAYVSFDLSEIDRTQIEEADLLLQFAPSGWGLASHLPDCTFNVYGLAGAFPSGTNRASMINFPETRKTFILDPSCWPKACRKVVSGYGPKT